MTLIEIIANIIITFNIIFVLILLNLILIKTVTMSPAKSGNAKLTSQEIMKYIVTWSPKEQRLMYKFTAGAYELSRL